MASKRMPSPTEDDINRVAETLNNLDIENNIVDANTFKVAFEDYFEDNKQLQLNTRFRAKVFNELQSLKGDKLTDKSLPRDETEKKLKSLNEFNRPRKIKGRIVFTKEVNFKIRGKEITRFRDKLGRFASNK